MINCLGWKRLRFRWQHPESKGKLDAVTLSHGFPKGHLRRPIVPKCSNIILQTSHQSCHFPCSFTPRRSLHQQLKLRPSPRSRRLEMSRFVWKVKAFAPKIDLQNLSFEWMNITLHASRSRTCSTFDQTQEMVWKNSSYKILPCLSVPHSLDPWRSHASTGLNWGSLSYFIFIGPQLQWTWQQVLPTPMTMLQIRMRYTF